MFSKNTFQGPVEDNHIKRFFSDNSGELKEGASELGLRHDASVADVKQTNGIAEQHVRRVKEEIYCLLLQYVL